MKLYQYFNLLLLLLIVLTAGYGWSLVKVQNVPDNVAVVDDIPKIAIDAKEVQASSFLVVDLTTGQVLAERASHEVVPLASLAKIITVLGALEETDAETLVQVSYNAIAQEGNSSLRAGEMRSIEELVLLSLITSSNDAAMALFEHDTAMAQRMYDAAWVSGADTVYLDSPSGLDTFDDIVTARGSAWDILHAVHYALEHYPSLMQRSVSEYYELDVSGALLRIANTNTLLPSVHDIIFSKTGYTDMAGGNVVMVVRTADDHDIAIVILGSTFTGRFVDAEYLLEQLIR